ncbi:MAG: exonuclease subunit SbcD, partial [Spirochaetaceae bacterium]|nr:exonuclease subunit SbcD [Spirochaetaceae bacterium]
MLRILHLADLHLGRIFHGESLIEDQNYLLDQLISHAVKNPPDAVLIAGDIYDRALPPVDAVKLFDRFLSSLADAGVTVVVIPGNHDSPGRMAY